MQPIWLLDIDGVINASPYKAPGHVWPADQWLIRMVDDSKGRTWKITAAQPVLNFLDRVHEEKWAEIVWLTTWQNDANNVADALFLPHFRVLENPMLDGTRYHGKDWWKLSEAMRVYVEGRPFIWTDDDITHQVRNILNDGSNTETLVIAPISSEGLTRKHLDLIATFLSTSNDRPFWREEENV